ncbi:MAG: hypothetical protein JO053_06650 [Acidobacteria bacterium]|nr:hypothetical protein [Acidobacteriota bacterium]
MRSEHPTNKNVIFRWLTLGAALFLAFAPPGTMIVLAAGLWYFGGVYGAAAAAIVIVFFAVWLLWRLR